MTFRACVDGGENGGIVKIDIAIGTIFLMSGDSRFVPLTTADVALMFGHTRLGFPRGLPNVRIVGIVFTVAVDFVDKLTGRKLSFVLAA